MSSEPRRRVDIAVVDAEERPLMVVQTQLRAADAEDVHQLAADLEASADPFPYAMLADPEHLRLFGWDGRALSPPVATLRTKDVLRQYEPEIDQIRVFKPYFTTLVQGWLRDLAYRWKSAEPPAAAAMRDAGVLDRIEGGSVATDMEIVRGQLRGVR